MEPIYIFPGSFCPPTYGHFEIVRKAAEILSELTIVCSRNPAKGNDWFTEEECARMWIDVYDLPDNVRVATFSDMARENLDLSRVVLVRGIRDGRDFFGEAATIDKNVKELGIDKFLHIVCSEEYREVSSSLVRELALQGEVDRMKRFVPSIIASTLMAKGKFEADRLVNEDIYREGNDWRAAERDMVRARFEPDSYRNLRHMNRQYD
ncbi:MAG: adenylyltransferase/cytidyltransferase family protein [Candidatus Uhrbacteria bacterium]